ANADPSQPSAEVPPAMASMKETTVDELFAELNRTPLFMTTIDESDGSGGQNTELEALKALAWEGTKSEVAANFREQGNECAKAKQWPDAREFYTKALTALRGPARPKPEGEEEEEVEMDLGENQVVDLEEEEKKEKAIEEASLVNRALCNLEMKNYRSCNADCAAVLTLNPKNIKAYYRSALACLSLDKIPEARDSCTRGLALDPNNAPLKALSTKIDMRAKLLAETERKRKEREERKRKEEATLEFALKARNVVVRKTDEPPQTEDAVVGLADPLDPASTLSFPVILLYPLHAQSDFIKAFAETETLGQHLEYIFPLPWDEEEEYRAGDVECYLETAKGGLVKVGKKVLLGKLLEGGKVEVVDGLVRVSVVPSKRREEWIGEIKRRKG
ncbi:TPR-like protein, partial [Saccharata proteae CBS 121410]